MGWRQRKGKAGQQRRWLVCAFFGAQAKLQGQPKPTTLTAEAITEAWGILSPAGTR